MNDDVKSPQQAVNSGTVEKNIAPESDSVQNVSHGNHEDGATIATPSPENSGKPQEPHPVSRRDLVSSIPKVALGSWLAMEGDQGLAFSNMMLFKKKKTAQPPTEIYGIWGFGWNIFGQLGVGSTTNRSSPVQVGNLTSWAELAGGRGHTLGRRTDGTLWAFGANSYGQLGMGDISSRNSPVQVGNLSSWAEVAAGDNHTLGRRTDWTLWAFGRNQYGQLAVVDTANRSSPVQVGNLSSWAELAVGSNHTLCRRTDGTLWAFGANAYGQLGVGSRTDRSSPVQVGNLSSWTEVAAGASYTHGRRTDGTLWAFGYNT